MDRGPGKGYRVLLGQVPRDGLGAGVVSGLEELLAQSQHQFDGLGWGRSR